MAARKQTAIVGLKVRLREPLRKKLEMAAKKKGVSLNAELVDRLEGSLMSDRQLILAYGGYWLPVIRSESGLSVALPIAWDEETGLDDELLPLNIAEADLNRIRNFFTGTPSPYDMSWRELNQADEEASREINIAEQEHEARLAKQRRK